MSEYANDDAAVDALMASHFRAEPVDDPSGLGGRPSESGEASEEERFQQYMKVHFGVEPDSIVR